MCGLEDENHLFVCSICCLFDNRKEFVQEFVQQKISYNKHMIIMRMFIGIQMFVNTNEVFEPK